MPPPLTAAASSDEVKTSIQNSELNLKKLLLQKNMQRQQQ
jgi:hypothetical protein